MITFRYTCTMPRDRNGRQTRVRTAKIMDRLTYTQPKHKRKETRKLRKTLQEKKVPPPKPTISRQAMKFGSFNVNGLNLEAGWAVQQLLNTRGFDVS